MQDLKICWFAITQPGLQEICGSKIFLMLFHGKNFFSHKYIILAMLQQSNDGWSSVKANQKLRITDQKSHWKSHITDCFIIFYPLYEDWPVMFYFFKELFLFLQISFLYFVSLFYKGWIHFFLWCKLVFSLCEKSFWFGD